jgi:DNA repair protein RadC
MEDQRRVPLRFWSEEDRPREKLMSRGKQHLSDAELLAIIIGAGNRNETAVELSRRILASLGNRLSGLGKLSTGDLCKFEGIGQAKAISILAALELGNRKAGEQPEERKSIQSSRDAFQYLARFFNDLPVEEFHVIFLNRANFIIKSEQISSGGITGTVVDLRVIVKKAIESHACGLILAHNHPSGNLNPSEADRNLTRKISEAGKILDIQLFDHLIIAERKYLSFADEGYI